MEAASDGGDGSPEAAVVDTKSFVGYLRRIVPLMLEGEPEVPLELDTALKDALHVDYIKKFLADSQSKCLLVERMPLKDEEEGDEGSATESGAESERERAIYTVNLDVHYSAPKLCSVAFIKRGAIVEADKKIASQIRFLYLSEGSPYETLHAYVSNVLAPYFKSFVRKSGKADRDGDKMVPSVEKKIAELEMGLLHLQQNIDIPEISLVIHQSLMTMNKKCQEEERRRPKVEDFGDKVEDSTFLNQLQNGVKRWIREIQKVTKLDRDPASGTALQEIRFWLNLERALLRIQDTSKSPDILLTLDILKHGKRFHATVSFDTDTGLKQALATVNNYNLLMKNFPLDDLLSATELDKICSALVAIFTHLKKLCSTKYPIQRALRLVEAISRDLSIQLLKVLGTQRLMHITHEEFEKIMVACFEVFTTWNYEYGTLRQLLSDINLKESSKMLLRVNPTHRRLQARLDQMRKFRSQQEQLHAVIVRVLQPPTISQATPPGPVVGQQQDLAKDVEAEALLDLADANAIQEVNLAYENVKEVGGLDVSKDGSELWEAAIKRYDEIIDRVETRITARLQQQLFTVNNEDDREMFRIFSRFNALFVRPRIQGAIREYQTQLIQRVKDDIKTLYGDFKDKYPYTYKMSKVRDLPTIIDCVIWTRQIDRRLSAEMRHVEDVLGKGWENHVEGQRLKAAGDSFRLKLNTQEVFDEWSRKIQQCNLCVSGRIFTIEAQPRGGRGNKLKVKVTILPEVIAFSTEVHILKYLGFRVPLAIVQKAHLVNQLYPFAISLIESVSTYERTCEKVEDKNSISPLVAGLRNELEALIAEGVGIVWESYKLAPYVQRLGEAVFKYQEKVDDLLKL